MTLKLNPPRIKHKYPHMSRNETALWSAFLDHEGSRILAVAYDVTVGQPGRCKPDELELYKIMWERITSKRIDAVALVPGAWEIIEVKTIPPLTAPGQALSYCKLFADKIKTTLPIIPALLCCQPHPDIITLCKNLNVKLYVLESPNYVNLLTANLKNQPDERT
jgi:hypothetical protein